jgi:hypothetical protein
MASMDNTDLLGAPASAPGRKTDQFTSLLKLHAPLGGQDIELQQLDMASGGMSLLRTRIRERSRFTVFDIDADTARRWGEALLAWAQTQPPR